MVELGQLESRHADFQAKQVRIVAVSTDSLEDARTTQQRFPHLTILADADQGLIQAVAMGGPHHSPDGREVVSPTTLFIDRQGIVRQIYRSDTFLTRLSAEEVLKRLVVFKQ